MVTFQIQMVALFDYVLHVIINMNNKILVIVGPTASGKSDIAVKLALEYNGEIISADSRQIYKDLDIATGKITADEMREVPHHCLDIADPQERFSVMDWKQTAERAIVDIQTRGKLPVICGGTGFYISALIDGIVLPEIPADPEEQKRLELKSTDELFTELEKLDPDRARVLLENSGSKNKRRLSRAIIIARTLGKVPQIESKPSDVISNSQVTFIGLTLPDEELKKRIHDRTMSRMKNGMIEEAKNLYANAISYERMRELGLEYRYLADFLENKITEKQLIDSIITKDWQYARRQKTWWRKDGRIKWFHPKEIEKIIYEIKK